MLRRFFEDKAERPVTSAMGGGGGDRPDETDIRIIATKMLERELAITPHWPVDPEDSAQTGSKLYAEHLRSYSRVLRGGLSRDRAKGIADAVLSQGLPDAPDLRALLEGVPVPEPLGPRRR